MINFKNNIILDNIDTWPIEVQKLLHNNKTILLKYFEEEQILNTKILNNLLLKYDGIKNPLNENWIQINKKINKMLSNHSIIGIHCTKLLDWEIEDIENNGLIPLNGKSANKRIHNAYNKVFLSYKLYKKLSINTKFSDNNRKNKIWFFHCLKTLQVTNGINVFFDNWGGESMFFNEKDNEELLNIGTSCIIFVSLKINKLDFYPILSNRLISIYLNNNVFEHDTDTIYNQKIKVLDIYKRTDYTFRDLTGILD